MQRNKHHLWTALAGLAMIAALSGCAMTRVHDSPAAAGNEPMRDAQGNYSNIKGMSRENVEYFKAKYPPESWKINSDNRVCLVGPAVFSQDAVNILNAAPGKAPAVVSDSNIMMATDSGQINFLSVKQYSGEVQSVVIQELTNAKVFFIKSIDDATGLGIYRGAALYSSIADEGIKHFVECTVGSGAPDGDKARRFRVYLRLIDTRSGIVVAAASGVDKDLMIAAKNAAVEMVKTVSVRQ